MGAGAGAIGVGTLNVEDWKNYRSPFLLIADTGADFALNGNIIDGTVGIEIKSAGYYEAMIYDMLGNPVVTHFCFWKKTLSLIEVVSEPVRVSDMQYQTQRSNAASNMMFYADIPVVGHVYDGSGYPVVSGIIASRSFYRDAADTIHVKILPTRSIYVYDDAVIWQASRAKLVGALVRPTTANGYHYKCTVAGTTGAVEPTWPTAAGDTLIDGTATWLCVVDTRELHYSQKVTS